MKPRFNGHALLEPREHWTEIRRLVFFTFVFLRAGWLPYPARKSHPLNTLVKYAGIPALNIPYQRVILLFVECTNQLDVEVVPKEEFL